MNRLSSLPVLLLLIAAFSGCILQGDNPEVVQREDIVKRVTVTIDESTEESERFEDVVKTELDYQHSGPDVDPDDVTVEYLGEDGKTKRESMRRHTSLDMVRSGDLVKIKEANFTSGLVVKTGSETLASREGLRTDWFTAEGVPIPVRTTKAGVAKYHMDSNGGIDFHASDFDFNGFGGEEGGSEFSRVDFTWDANVDSDLTARTGAPASGLQLTLDGKVVGKTDFEGEAVVREDGETTTYGAKGDAEARIEGLLKFLFDSRDRLNTVGYQGSLWADGDFTAWDEEHPKSSNWHPEDIEHPFVDEKFEYEEEEVSTEATEDAWVVEFLNRIWSTRIGVGDEYRLHASSGDDPMFEFSADVVVQVTNRELREVKAGRFDTYRVSTTVDLRTKDPETGSHDFDLLRQKLWVNAENYLPVAEESQFTKSYDRKDFEQILKAFGEDSPASVPRDARLFLKTTNNAQLTEYSGDLMTSPLLSLGGVSGMSQVWVAGAVFVLLQGITPEQSAARVGYVADETMDQLVVSSVPGGAYWSDYDIAVQSCTQNPGGATVIHLGGEGGDLSYENEEANSNGAALNEASLTGTSCGAPVWRSVSYNYAGVTAGDFLAFCASPLTADPTQVRLQIRHLPANEIIYEHTFVDIANC